jgi:hypothetical protein
MLFYEQLRIFVFLFIKSECSQISPCVCLPHSSPSFAAVVLIPLTRMLKEQRRITLTTLYPNYFNPLLYHIQRKSSVGFIPFAPSCRERFPRLLFPEAAHQDCTVAAT